MQFRPCRKHRQNNAGNVWPVGNEGLNALGKWLASHAARQKPKGLETPRYHGDKAEWVFSSWTETWLSKDFSSRKLDEDLRNVHCPVLVLHGDNDEYGSSQHARRIESLTHGPAILKVLSHCGHVPHRETQPIVMDAISEFLTPLR
jgi:pimeloyl-ACP methyl ester carboxylesterase